MAHMARIRRDIKEINECTETVMLVSLDRNDHSCLNAKIGGLPESSYEDGLFKIQIRVPEQYPFRAPKITFLTKIWHPNIDPYTGEMYYDIFKYQWSPAITMKMVLFAVQGLLLVPETDTDTTVIGMQYNIAREIFNSTAKYWTAIYAGGSYLNDDYDEKVSVLMSNGTARDTALTKLSYNNWDLNKIMLSRNAKLNISKRR